MKLNKNGISIQLLKDVKHGLERLNPKKLGTGQIFNGRCFCALGAAAMHRVTKEAIYDLDTIDGIFFSTLDRRNAVVDSVYKEPGSTHVWSANDDYGVRETEEQRYTRMYGWVCEELENV